MYQILFVRDIFLSRPYKSFCPARYTSRYEVNKDYCNPTWGPRRVRVNSGRARTARCQGASLGPFRARNVLSSCLYFAESCSIQYCRKEIAGMA
jgi:hypothetical protein